MKHLLMMGLVSAATLLMGDVANAQCGYGGYGYGGYGYQSPGISFGYSSYSYPQTAFSIGYNSYPSYGGYRYSSPVRGHYDYYGSSVVRHGNHYDYVPAHSHYHRGHHH
ncbi:MAG: hypothetical protein R3C49_13290 [Planctomycetaceae bacterium]